MELDALYWGPDGTKASLELFQERTAQALGGDRWMVDGNYSKARGLIWSRADIIVWRDYSLPLILGRLLRRTLRRVVLQEELWNGNRERFREAFFSRDSIFLWAFQTYRRRRKEYPVLLSKPEYAHLQVIRLRSPRATREWLSRLVVFGIRS